MSNPTVAQNFRSHFNSPNSTCLKFHRGTQNIQFGILSPLKNHIPLLTVEKLREIFHFGLTEGCHVKSIYRSRLDFQLPYPFSQLNLPEISPESSEYSIGVLSPQKAHMPSIIVTQLREISHFGLTKTVIVGYRRVDFQLVNLFPPLNYPQI